MRSVGQLALAQSRVRSRAAFTSSWEEVSLAPRALDVLKITGSAGSPTLSTTAGPPAVVPPVVDPSVYIVTWDSVSRINCKLRIAVIACWGAAPSGYTSQEPLLEQGHSIRPERSSLEVSVLYQALGGRAPTGSNKAVTDGRVKRPATGVVWM